MAYLKQIFLFCLFLVLAPYPYAASCETGKTQIPVHVGAILAESGDWASWGTNCHRGIELAAGQYKENIVIHYEDSNNALPKNALSAYRRLQKLEFPQASAGKDPAKIKIFLGPQSPEEVNALSGIADRDGALFVSFASTRQQSKNIISMCMDPHEYGARVAREFIGISKMKAAVLSSDYQWETQVANGFKTEYRKLGGEVILLEEPAAMSQDVSSQILRLKNTDYDVLFIPSYTLIELYLRELNRIKLADRVPVYAVELDDSIIKRLGALGSGVMYLNPAGEKGAQFSERFKTAFGESPAIPAPQCYDGANILFEAITKSLLSVESIKNYFNREAGFKGATGSFYFRDSIAILETKFFTIP